MVDRCQQRRGVVERHPHRDPAPGEADPVADEQEPVGAGDVVEIELPDGVVGEACDRPHLLTLIWSTIRRLGSGCP